MEKASLVLMHEKSNPGGDAWKKQAWCPRMEKCKPGIDACKKQAWCPHMETHAWRCSMLPTHGNASLMPVHGG
eukprot:342083-Chlamydomonas_euryale.AAC.3